MDLGFLSLLLTAISNPVPSFSVHQSPSPSAPWQPAHNCTAAPAPPPALHLSPLTQLVMQGRHSPLDGDGHGLGYSPWAQ